MQYNTWPRMKSKPHKTKTLYFSDRELVERLEAFCAHRGIAPGHALQLLLQAFLDDMELQRDMMEVSLPSKEVRFV